MLENLINADSCDFEHTSYMIEELCSYVIGKMKEQGITASDSDYLESHALVINDRIREATIRNLPIML